MPCATQYSTTPPRSRVVVPHAQLDLHGGDLRDAPRLFDLADGDVAQADRLDQAVALQRRERAHARRQRRARIGRVELIEIDALDAERSPAGLAGGGQMARAAVRHPAAARARQAALGRDDDAPGDRRSTRERARDQPLVVPDVRSSGQ